MKKLKLALLLAITIMGGGKSFAHDIEVANADGVTIYYNFINDQTELAVTFQGSSSLNADYAGNVVIPESVTYEGNTYPVTSIGNQAFRNCSNLTELTIPGSVISIGSTVFGNCSGLTELTIGNSVASIGNYAFQNCSCLTELTIPNSVTSIGNAAFMGCSGLTELTIPDSVTAIGEDTFDHCSGLTKVIIGNSVTSIGNYAFCFCRGLKELTIPNSVTYIGRFAFQDCSSLTEVTIGNGMKSFGNNPFANCINLEKITVESSNPNYDSRENCNAIIETNSNELIIGCKNTYIPGNVTAIGQYAFSYCSDLTELTIPGSVTAIGNSAFHNSSSLTTLYSLNITPPNVETYAFDTSHYKTVNVYVPEEALTAYQADKYWSKFQKLQGFEYSSVKGVSANAEQIQSANGQITVTGLTDGTTVAVYDLSGQQVGTATSKGGQATVSTGMTAGAAAVVKVGDKSVKTMMK